MKERDVGSLEQRARAGEAASLMERPCKHGMSPRESLVISATRLQSSRLSLAVKDKQEEIYSPHLNVAPDLGVPRE